MSNIHRAFDHGKAFIGFVTGGDPTFDLSLEFIVRMAKAGADLIEIGIPFSDPIAEGAAIQNANLRTLRTGATVDTMLEPARAARRRAAALVFLTYLNPVFHRGYDRFFGECRDAGVDGIIIPDLPFEEQGVVRDTTAACGVDVITMIAPTSKERVRRLAAQARGFVYAVSSMGVTGVRSELYPELGGMLEEIRRRSRWASTSAHPGRRKRLRLLPTG